MSARCPCCGQPVAPHKVLVDKNSLSVAHNGVIRRLGRRQIAILRILADAFPRSVSGEDIARAVSDAGLSPSRSSLSTCISQMRPALADLGLSIITKYGEGFKLDVTAGAVVA